MFSRRNGGPGASKRVGIGWGSLDAGPFRVCIPGVFALKRTFPELTGLRKAPSHLHRFPALLKHG